jgi:hypothetical protein
MTAEVPWSDLQRDPEGVAALADRGEVRVRRRDGVALLLVREDRAHAAADGMLAAARALRTAMRRLGDAAPEALTEEFPWAGRLPDDDRLRFAGDFGRAVQASAELGQWDPLARALVEWRATAAVHADSELADDLSRPVVDDLGPVPPPAGTAPAAEGRWEPRFATSAAVTGWEELDRADAEQATQAWAALTAPPAHPRHRLRGALAERDVGGRTLHQWRYDLAAGAAIWCCPDADRRVVWVVAVAPVRQVTGR